eukprot:3220865-Pyramimonas_sp.AAC.1
MAPKKRISFQEALSKMAVTPDDNGGLPLQKSGDRSNRAKPDVKSEVKAAGASTPTPKARAKGGKQN